MIDMHCHLLPGLDDGPATLDEAVAMARMAVADGISHSALTPHIHPGRFDNDSETIATALNAFQQELDRQGVPLTLHLGAEVRVCLESLDLLRQGRVPFVGEHKGFRVVLLEMPHHQVPVGCLQMVEKLLQMHIQPMLAHPERNKVLMDQPGRLAPFLAEGCWLQLTAGAITGDFGRTAQRVAHRWLDDDAVRVVASDAHNLGSRPPRLSQAHAFISQRWGPDMASDLMWRHPAQMLGLNIHAGQGAA